MRSLSLLKELEYHDDHPYAQPLYVDEHGRALLFMLKPGQKVSEHEAPSSPFYVVILQGQGTFTDGAGAGHSVKPHDFLVFDPGEKHAVQAGADPLVFLGILHGVPGAREGKVSGKMVEG
jgi:quercetin dioxygenase-like cupin family protein